MPLSAFIKTEEGDESKRWSAAAFLCFSAVAGREVINSQVYAVNWALPSVDSGKSLFHSHILTFVLLLLLLILFLTATKRGKRMVRPTHKYSITTQVWLLVFSVIVTRLPNVEKNEFF